ncbi:MAG: FtsH protease activity modulator HflK [Candidatus Neomarinimicrobiota bacterium]|nr:MAG: FtsH protease activity modulator HflK [Candidatus Neomarinimicrobiota bacterium]
MTAKKVKIGDSEIEVSSSQTFLVIIVALLIVVVVTIAMSFYTIDANENGVILRFGKYHKTTYPGLHLKLPWGIDKLYTVRVDYQWKEEFGFRTARPGVKTIYSKNQYTDESWMLTGDLNIADVQWIVQYKIKDPIKFLFNVREQSGTIRAVAEAAMRFVVGDRSFQEVLQSDRRKIALLAQDYMQQTLDQYDLGVDIQLVQLITVQPPGPVFDSYNEVNRAKQEQETAINEASQVYNKEIFRVEGEAKRIVQEARGYAIDRTNRAKGDAELFTSVYNEYMKAKDVTRQRLYLETMESVMKQVNEKILIDKGVKSLVPFLNLSGKEVAK